MKRGKPILIDVIEEIARIDMFLYGESFVLKRQDGTKENIHPSRIKSNNEVT